MILPLILSFFLATYAHPEAFYLQQWCNEYNGIAEYVLDDRTRIDCLTETHAVEFDFAPKWAEAVGQSLHYGIKTGKLPGIVLIVEKPEHYKYYDRIKPLAEKYGITVWLIKNKP